MVKAVYQALKPSNVQIPKGMKIKMARRINALDVAITLLGRFETLFSTAEEVLEDLEAAVSTLEASRA